MADDVYSFTPAVTWDPEVERYLRGAFGDEPFRRISDALARPPRSTCMRVNTLRRTPQEVVGLHSSGHAAADADAAPAYAHPLLPYVVVMPGSGPHAVDYSVTGGREVVISRKAGEAVMRGAPVYSPGVLAASAGLRRGDLVAVSVARERPGTDKPDITRGTTLPHPGSVQAGACSSGEGQGPEVAGQGQGQGQGAGEEPQPQPQGDSASPQQLLPSSRAGYFIGVGRAAMTRAEMFRSQGGLAVAMESPVFRLPSPQPDLLLGGDIVLQNLPSIVAAQALGPAPGMRVLDMCAAPGGKTTMLAQLMQDRGEVIGLDRTNAKALQVVEMARLQGLTCIRACKADSATIVNAPTPAPAAPGGQVQAQAQAGAAASAKDAGADADAGMAPPSAAASAAAPVLGAKVAAREARRAAAMLARGIVSVEGQAAVKCPGYEPETFDAVLLDAPCSALGLRPRLAQAADMTYLRQCAQSQRRLADAAVKLVRPGGHMTYSTCSISPGENEAVVRYILDRHGHCMRLLPALPRVGGPGLVGSHPQRQPLLPRRGSVAAPAAAAAAAAAEGGVAEAESEAEAGRAGDSDGDGSSLVEERWLSAEEAAMVQRFDPADEHGDTIGFFVAKFEKFASWWP